MEEEFRHRYILSKTDMKYYIGIDGGGTKSYGVLADENMNIIANAKAGCSNPNDIGVDGTVEVVSNMINELKAQIGSDCELLSVFAGISGASSRKDVLKRRLSEHFGDVRIEVGTDAENLICAGLHKGDVCCIICGTGCVCYVRKNGETYRIGGWGHLIDSAGSGYHIGKDGIEAALRAHDGRGDSTLISSYLKERLGGDAREKISEIYDGGKPYIASLAECVFLADDEGDMVAGNILQRNAYALYEYLEAAYKILEKPFTCVIGGGIAENHSSFTDLLKDISKNLPCEILINSRGAEYGALELARRI